ncbi:MAG TPA: DoxX family protein [Thermoanaerobaculia bacterium]|nr:DoxX family protein [Thermoanaerobaculia bacterium]
MNPTDLYLKTTALAEKVFAPFGSLFILVLRLVWGWQFLTTGLGKLQNHARVTDFFTSLGIPMPGLNAWFVGGLETVGGALLLLGLFSRPIAFLLTGNMFVAYLTGDRPALLGVFSNLDAFQKADPFMYLLVSALVLTLGPGAISLDRLLTKVIREKREREAQAVRLGAALA